MTARLASLVVIAYAAMLCAVGALGIAAARWELAHVFHFPVDVWPHDVRATFLNQYRFMKAIELGAGVACLVSRRAILAGGHAGWLFLLLVAGGAIARGVAWIADGTPALAFQIFLALEVLVFAATLAHLRARPEHA